MFIKNQSTWERSVNYENTTVFKTLLEKLKTYSKCFNSSTYSTTSTLMDVYKTIKFQHSLWVKLTNFAPESITIFGLEIKQGYFYNLLKYTDSDTILNSVELKKYLELGWIKAASSKLFEDETPLSPTRKDWFCFYEPHKNNEYLNKPFDYLVIRYNLKDSNSQDLDTRTALVNTNYQDYYNTSGSVVNNPLTYPLDGNDIGWNRNTSLSSTSGEVYLMWGGDATSNNGENILIDFKNISKNITYLEDIQVRLRAYFYTTKSNGKIELDITTYKGGVMNNVGLDFVNIGGVVVQNIKSEREVVTENASDINGDDLGTIIYNVENSNAILTTIDNIDIKNNNYIFSDLLNVIDFNSYEWQMGTSGYNVNDINYTDMIIPYNFTEDILFKDYQNSYIENGYTETNVFTSEKVWDKLLNHFYVIDIATTEHIDISDINNNPIPYPLIDIDGIRVVNQHRVLFKNQNDTKQNGIYLYNNGEFIRDIIFKTDDDLKYFSCFVKEGNKNKNKEFFLDSNEDGTYPSFDKSNCDCVCECSDKCLTFTFKEGNNYILRNRSSYKLLADHMFTDSEYFIQQEPVTPFDYTHRYYDNGTNFNLVGNGYFEVVSELNKLKYVLNDEILYVNNAGSSSSDKINQRIDVINNTLYLLRNENEIVTFNNFTNIPNNDIFTSITKLEKTYSDFELTSSSNGLFLVKNIDNQEYSYLDNISFNINNSIINNTYILNKNAVDIALIDDYIFYLTFDGVYLYKNNKNYKIRNINFPTKLRVEKNSTEMIISYLINDIPELLKIEKTELDSLLAWNKNEDYEVVKFSKFKIKDWEIISNQGTNNLYLKNDQITNLPIDKYFTEIPKILSTNSRYFDGEDDFSDLNAMFDSNINNIVYNKNISLSTLTNKNVSQGSFTLEFKITPEELRGNQTPIYLGDKDELYRYTLGDNLYTTRLNPVNYIAFVLNTGDDYPAFIVKENTKELIIKSNQKLNISEEVHVSFVWNFTSNKSYAELYLNGILVGSYIDQKTPSNTPIDIRDFSLERAYLGKSQIITTPKFKGFMREVRLWNKALNSSQITTRLNKDINKDNENFISNLIGYWKMDDKTSVNYNLAQGNNFFISQTSPLSMSGAAFFNGGLNNDIYLKEIQNPKLIQLDDKNLYILDSKNKESYEIKLSSLEQQHFQNLTIIGDEFVQLIKDPIDNQNCFFIDTFAKTLKIDITNTNKWDIIQTIQENDIIEVEVETYCDSNSTCGGISISHGTNSVANNSVGIWSTSAIWTTIKTNLIVPINTNIVQINLNVEYTGAYFRNLKIEIKRETPIYNIYIIDLFKEKLSRIRSSYNIDSIYLEIKNLNNVNKLYTLENNDVFVYNNNNNNFNLLEQSYFNVKDFSISNNNIYYLDNNLNIWNGTNSIIYTESTSFNIETIYSFDDLEINKNIIYVKEVDDNINILSKNLSSNTNLDYIATYPLIVNNVLDFSIIIANNSITKTLELKNNKVYFDNNDLDINNKYYGLNLKSILGIYKKDDSNAFILTKTLNNEIKLWLYKTYTNTLIKVADYKNETTLFISEKDNISLQYYTITKPLYEEEWIVINDDKTLLFYQLEKDNKINYKKLSQELYINTYKTVDNIYNYTNTNMWLLLKDGDKEYISTFTNTNNNYNLWNDVTSFTKIETGWLIGESGILFKDVTNKGTNGSAFTLEYVNIIYKDDLNAIDAIKTKKDRNKGYKVKEWSGTVYLVGDMGRVIKTHDNGTTWSVLSTDNYNDFKAVSFFDDKNGLIVGLNNTVLATFSGGDSFVSVEIPDTIGIRDWYDVKFYDTNKALIVGSLGSVLHLTKNDFIWKVDKILNNIPLSELNISIKQSDLDDYIKMEINKEVDKDLYRQTIRKIDYLENDEFLLIGDNNMISHLRLSPQIAYIIPYLNFLQSNITANWIDVKSYNDIVKNEKRAFMSYDNKIYSFEWNRFNQNDNVNIENVELSLFQENLETIKNLSISDNNLISCGRKVSAYKKEIFTFNEDGYVLVEYIKNPTFKNNATNWIQYNSNKNWSVNNSLTIDLSTSGIASSKLIYTDINLEINDTYLVDLDFTISPNGYLEVVYADSLTNLLSGNYLFTNSYSLPIIPFNVSNTSGITHIGFIAHATSNNITSFNITKVSITNYEYVHNREIIYSDSIEQEDLRDIFKPRMLFLDYYMGRKINIHREDGNFVIPTGKLDKNNLECFYFRNNEYIEFSDYGTIDNQNNYLAYQDHYMLNRRILDQPNSWGKTQQPYNKYNKRMTSIDNYKTHAIWSGELSNQGTNSDSIGFEFYNENVTDLEFYNIGDLREDSHTTKLRLAWNNTNDSYSTTGLVTQSIILFSDFIIDDNLHRYTFKTNSLLGLNEGDLIKLDFTDSLYYVRKEFISSGNKYIEADGITIPSPNYTGSITKAVINFIDNVKTGDVINLISLDKDRNIELKLNDKVYLEILAGDLSIAETSVVKQKDEFLYYLEYNLEQFDISFEVLFAIGSTIDEVLLDLKKESSIPVQLAKYILEKRCNIIGEAAYETLELNVFDFIPTFKNMTDITLNTENNKLYVTTLDKKLFVVDVDDNNVSNIINLSTPSKYNTYNPYFKYLYISGGDNVNTTIDIINTITNLKITTINVGDSTIKPVYNPFNKLMYIPTIGNKCLLYNGVTQAGVINTKFNDLVFISYNNLMYTISTDNLLRIYNDTTLVNTITLGNSLLKMKYDEKSNFLYITSTTGVYIINIINNLVDFVSIPKGVSYTTGFELVDFIGDVETKKAILISNANLTDTNFYISVIDRDTKSLVKEIYTDISVRDIKFNKKENLIYLGGKTGQILLMNATFDLLEMDINSDINLYNIKSGSITSLFYNELNDRIYPLKDKTYQISYLLTDKLEPSNIKINLNTLTSDITTVVRNVTPDNKIGLWDLFTDEMVYELNSQDKKLIVKNLNYFDGDLLTLKNNFDKHLLGNSYNIIINKENYIQIDGYVNDLTKYYNLESFVTYATFGTNTTLNIDTIEVKYDKDIIYGANYSLLSFLKNLNPLIFNNNYSFNLYSNSYIYEPLYRTALGEFKEFTITNNRIYVGEDLISILNFKKGTFIDITNNSKSVSRVYIKDIQTSNYTDYPDKKRFIIITDKALETNLDLTGLVTLRTRDTLEEISMDLEFTDDLMFPISNGGSNSVVLSNNTYYNNRVTSFEYAKILLNDSNIRDNVSSIIHLDENSDWILSVINWKDDPNFYYRPLELFEAGVDRVLKKSITVDSSNYLVTGNTLQLKNIDFNRYNYRIVDGMTLKQLEEKYYWVLNADIRNAIIGEDDKGFVWYQGDWISGTWEEGTWYSGKAYDIEWLKGDVYSHKIIDNFNLISTEDDKNPNNTIWYKSIWFSGVWNNGTWNNGSWKGGEFNGKWNGGIWEKGVWNGGSFNGGEWLSGTWLSGNFSQNNSYAIWHSGTWLGGDFENGTWKTGIFDQTDRVASRFGTKATLLNNAVWEYGWWKNGEFHSYLNIDNNTNSTLPSTNYKYSVWYNGTWEKGTFYGGQWEMGSWKNGVWENGYFKSSLNISEWRVRTSDVVKGKMVEVEFTTPHYFKDLTIGVSDLGNLIKLQNSFVILGEPDIIEGKIHPNSELLGYNTKATKHIVSEILDEKTVLININDENYPYELDNGTSGYLENIDLNFESGTSYLIDSIIFDTTFGSDKEKSLITNDKLYLLNSYTNNSYEYFEYGNKNALSNNNPINKPADIYWHKKSNKTFITSGYDNASFISNTKFEVYDKNNSNIYNSPNITGANFISYDVKTDSLILTSRCLLDSSSSGNANAVYFVNPYNYTFQILTISNINSDIVNNAVLNRPFVNQGTSFYSIKYKNQFNQNKSALISIDNVIKNVSYSVLNINNTAELEGWDDNRNKIVLKESTSGETYLYEVDELFSNKKMIINSTSGHLFSKYLDNKKELFIIDNNELYTWNGNGLTPIKDFGSKINSIIWSVDFNSYFIACNNGVKALSSNKKDILYNYNINNALEFAYKKDADKIYVLTNDKLYLIMDDICKNQCTDYSVFVPELIDSIPFEIQKFQYKGVPKIASEWSVGKFKGGIFDYGYWANGLWQGGIWLDGVFENGEFGTN